MKPFFFATRRKPRTGFALVIVLGFLVLLTVLILAFFTSVTTDFASTKQYSSGAATKQLADSVVQVVMGQIKTATVSLDPTTNTNLTWASQPGMIRSYDNSGQPVTNYKLYSSDAMTVAGPLSLGQVSDFDTQWSANPALWTDLNAPVTDATNTANYPIIDGNHLVTLNGAMTYDADGDGQPDVQGFSILNAPTSALANSNPVPMPVKWLYQLRDGTLAAATDNKASTVIVVGASAANPIVGRVGFWTDDETSKLNINTACGDEWKPAQINTPSNSPYSGNPTYTPPGAFWDVPRAYTSYDFNNLAILQPAQHEYQRYPGHPATVYLSAVFPTLTRDNIFSIVPRVSGGGSEGGTVIAPGTLTPDADRLYASVDELLFKSSATSGLRDLNDGTKSIIDKATLERAKFFLSASSSAPEVNLFGKPRIAVWPIDQDVVTQAGNGSQSPRGTAFDSLIAFCGHIGARGSGNDYFFQRTANGYLSQTQDYDLNLGATAATSRNHILYAYLQGLVNSSIPGFGGSLASKFGADTDQILTEIFDYIRCVNPSDDNIAFLNTPAGTSPTNDSNCYTPNEQYTTAFLSGGYNVPVLVSKPYHAFIAPARLSATQGFGRTVTLSEIGFEFICNGDGSLGTFANYTGSTPPVVNTPLFYTLESNQPYPISDARAKGQKRNVDLVLNTPLTPTQRRVQSILLLNPYTVAPGYSTMHMDIGIEVIGLDKVTVNGRPIGFPADKTIVMSNPTYRTPHFGVNLPFFYNDYLAPISQLVDATSQTIGDTNTTNPKGNTNANSQLPPFHTYEFISSPFTVDTSAGTMALGSSGTVTIKIWHLSAGDKASLSLTTPSSTSTLVQTISLDLSKLAAAPLQIPTLATSVDTNFIHDNFITPEDLWDFSWAGVFGDYSKSGRLWDEVGNSGHYFESCFVPGDVVRTMVPGYPTDKMGVAGDYRLLAAQNFVPSTVFVPHRLATDAPTNPFSNSLPNMYQNGWQLQALPGATDVGPGTSTGIGAPFGALITSIPPNPGVTATPSSLMPVLTGDYDNGLGSDMDGPYINKPDTGYQYQHAADQTYPYFGHFAEDNSPSSFSPNRQIASPGMFGSLPVGVKRGLPWQTLLFRPQPTHPDGVPVPDAGTPTTTGSPYGTKVADHLIMDLFWMPVVEPYALSEPLSTAGKINLNYQIAPFTYITRATAIDALLKSQRILAIPNLPTAKNWKMPLGYGGVDAKAAPPSGDFRYDLNLSNTDGTLRQFEATFAKGDVFRSPTQICDIYLTPQGQSWTSNAQAELFWAANQLTGDNSRERPYANLYGCLTTKSNTYTIHFRVQSLQKVPGTDPTQWVESKDRVTSEFRGSSLIERYVDPADPKLVDFAAPANANQTVDSFYKFRVVSTKKFAP